MQWEYCILEWLRFNPEVAQRVDEAGKKENVLALCGVRFCENGAVRQHVLGTITTPQAMQETQLFAEGMGRLGGFGWELVQIQEKEDGWDVSTATSAFFKRPVQEGRSIDDAVGNLAAE